MPTPHGLSSSVGAPADVVRRQYLSSATGDMDDMDDMESWRTAVAADVGWTEAAGFPLARTDRTPDGVISGGLERLAAAWDNWIAHDDTYLVQEERVVVLGRYSAPATRPPARR